MITKSIIPEKHGSRFSWGQLLWIAIALMIFSTEVFAQNYQVTMNPRRLGDMMGVELWIKDVSGDGSAPALGNATFGITYNTANLIPAALDATTGHDLENPDPTTDSINTDIDQATPYTSISSGFTSSALGYNALSAQAVTATSGGTTLNAFVLDVNFNAGGSNTGAVPSSSGRGTFIGMLKFDIINHTDLDCTDSADFAWNTYTFAADITIEDINGNDMEATSSLYDPDNVTIRGVTVLNPNGPNQAVNRFPDPAYASLTPNKGYPIYFERSGLEDPSAGDEYGTDYFAYLLEYSLDGGSGWTTLGRIAETNAQASAMGGNEDYWRSGEIDSIDGTNDYFITKGDGTIWANPSVSPVGADGYNGVLRCIWKSSENFPYRSENAKIKVTQLEAVSTVSSDIDNRTAETDDCRMDASNSTFVLGRLFFVQLDGTSGYFRTKNKYSNATQLTVEAWVNLNSSNGAGSEPAIVASSGGVSSPEEGAWMLYLYDGNRPAFRAREIEGRGTNGYLANVIAPAYDSLTTTSDAIPITDAHGQNWMHVAATVADNVVTLYINGEIVAQETNSQSVNPRMLTTLHPIWIGVNPTGGIDANDYLHAGIKEVRVWRYALSQSDLKSHIGGVYDANGTITALTDDPTDERTALELDYIFQGTRLDVADDITYQYNANPLNYYTSTSLTAAAQNTLINYRPDRSHIRLTSPTGGEGVSNLQDEVFEVRWAAYGLGKTQPNSDDIQIMISRDGGSSWFDAIDNQNPTAYLLNDVEIESGVAYWEPYNGITTAGTDDDLQGIVPIDDNWSKKCVLRISGTEARGQDNIYDQSGEFTVAPYFALSMAGSANVTVPTGTDLNLTGANGYIEAWIKPYRFPTETEEFFPIVSKISDDGSNLHYSLHLLPSGRLEFNVASSTGDALRTATSDTITRIVEPNVRDFDSTWVHVGVWFNLANGNQSAVFFYIDGLLQDADAIQDQLGTNITVDIANTYRTFIGAEPISATETRYFVGDMKEVRFWGGNPGGQSPTSGGTPSDMTKFIQGASTIRADELSFFGGQDYSQNLLAAFTFNGGPLVGGGKVRSIASYPTSSNIIASIEGTVANITFKDTKPTIKLVEPKYKQAVPNTKTDLRVRWVGFDYNRNTLTSFRNGSDKVNHADLEFGVKGGGATDVVHYQYVASETYSTSYINAMTLPTVDASYEFQGTADKSQYSLELDVSNSDPDLNDDQTYNDQGEVDATMTNGRVRLKGRSTINGITLEYDNDANGYIQSLLSESPLFDITPPSNFTVRVLLEGYHTGKNAVTGGIQSNLGTAYDTKGLKIKLYTNNANQPGVLVDSAESTEQYATFTQSSDIANRNAGNMNFANVPFVFTELADGRYFVVVEHLNHLPIMSKYAARFIYSGDTQSTWEIESGWDFQNWDGTNLQITETEASAIPPTIGSKYTAFGYSINDRDLAEWSATGLNYNEGRSGATGGDELAAMVGGDCVKDYKIDGLDRTRVRLDAAGAGTAHRSDITGDGPVNATDRDIVDRNNGKNNSLNELTTVTFSSIKPNYDPSDELLEEAPEMSQRFINQTIDYLNKGGEMNRPSKVDKPLAGGIAYTVSSKTERSGNVIDVSLYIKNDGAQFAMGNATFGVKYDPSGVEFQELINFEDVIFSANDERGYAKTYSGPGPNAIDPIPALRTIEVDYDAFTRKSGFFVPGEETYLGTLRFNIVKDKEIYPFDWHDITVVLTTDGHDVTGDGDFDDIEDEVNLKTTVIKVPNGGESWRSGQVYTVSWTKSTTDKPVHVEYSIDNGATWNRITAAPISLNNTFYNWKTPNVSSTECLVAVVDAETKAIIDRSDAPFTLMPSLAQITRPTADDGIYAGGNSDFINWLVEDQANVRFEFSIDGANNWMPVSADAVNSDAGSVEWVVPVVNTKNATVRMINNETNEVMAVSEPFKILAGALTLKKINPANEVQAGEERDIKWIHNNVSKFDLQFSPDGTSWETFARDVNANSGAYKWLVPQVMTDNALIRAIWNNDDEMEYSRTPEFAIGTVGVEEGDKPAFVFDKPVPNPFTVVTNINFTVPFNERVTITLFNSAGVKVRTLVNSVEYSAGQHNLALYGQGLTQGVYYVHINAGVFSQTREVVLIK